MASSLLAPERRSRAAAAAGNPYLHAELLRGLAAAAGFLVAMALGAAAFGAASIVLIVTTFAVPVASRGAQLVLLRASAQGSGRWAAWRTVPATARCCMLSTAVAVLGAQLLHIDLPLAVVITLAAAEAGPHTMLTLRAAVHHGNGDGVTFRRVMALASSVRLAPAICIVFIDGGVGTWAFLFAAGGLLGVAALGVAERGALLTGDSPAPDGDWPTFALNSVAVKALDDMDKIVLQLVAGSRVVGVYVAAYRFAALALIPVRGILSQSLAGHFSATPEALVTRAARTARRAVKTGVAAATALTLLAPALPVILGREFTGAAWLVAALGPAFVLRGAHYAYADVLTASDRQRSRVLAVLLGLALPAMLLFPLVHSIGALGAVLATALGELSALLFIRRMLRHDRRVTE